MIRGKIAEMMTGTTRREHVYLTTGLAERGDVDYSIESALVQDLLLRERLGVITTRADRRRQGFIKEYPYERYLRDAAST